MTAAIEAQIAAARGHPAPSAHASTGNGPTPAPAPKERTEAREKRKAREARNAAKGAAAIARVGRYCGSPFEGQPVRRYVLRTEEEARRLDEVFYEITNTKP